MKSIATLAALTTLTLLGVAKAQEGGPNCTAFTWDKKPGYILPLSTSRVSAAQTCPNTTDETHACPIVASGDDQHSFSTNVSKMISNPSWVADGAVKSFFHSLILPAVNESLGGAAWENSVIGLIDTTQMLEPGTSGYLNFTSYKRCFAGALSNCTGDGVTDGMGIEACAPVAHTDRTEDGMDILDGEYIVVNISEKDVGNFRDPFSGQSRGAGERSEVGICVLLSALAVGFAALL